MRASEERALVVERATTAVRARVQVVAWWRGESDVLAAASSRVNGCHVMELCKAVCECPVGGEACS